MCVRMYVAGGLSISEAAVSPLGLSLITPLTPQEALDVVWLHNSLIELIWEIRKGGVESVNPAPRTWNPVAAASFFTCLPGRLVNFVCAGTTTLKLLELLLVCVCLCACVYNHPPLCTDMVAPHMQVCWSMIDLGRGSGHILNWS